MNVYIITYDLSWPGQNYDQLFLQIKSCGPCIKVTESSWAVSTQWSLEEVFNHLAPALDCNDRILVGELGSSVWENLGTHVSNWLKWHIEMET